jgi:TolB-like protein
MKSTYLLLLVLLIGLTAKAQSAKIAVLDFDNVSGNTKYTGLGKAMSSMLITDIEANTSKEKVQFIERGQIQKILKEQNFQSTKSVEKSSAVKTGKILGVKYLLIGDIFVLNDQLIINARLTNAETGEITFSKKQEGKLSEWLKLKTNIAIQLSKSLSLPFKTPSMNDKEIGEATIIKFGEAVEAKDNGDFKQAGEILASIQSNNPGFSYINDLKNQLDRLSKKVENAEKNVEILISQVKNIDSRITEIESKINSKTKISTPNSLEDYLVNSILAYNDSDYKTSEIMFEKVFEEGYIKYDLVYKYYDVLFNNYDGDDDLIKQKISQGALKDNLLTKLVELDYNLSGIEYYIRLDKIKIDDPLLKAYLENKKAKTFYVDVQKYGTDKMKSIMAFWTPIFDINEKKMGKRMIKTKPLFFDYNKTVKTYFESTSHSNDENYVWNFYYQHYKENPELIKQANQLWEKLTGYTTEKVEKVEKDAENLSSRIKSVDSENTEIARNLFLEQKIASPNSLEDYLINSMLAFKQYDLETSEIMLEKVFKEGYIKYDLVHIYYQILSAKYSGDKDLIKQKISQGALKENQLTKLVELDEDFTGLSYYSKLYNIKIEDPLLKAYLENKKAKTLSDNVEKNVENEEEKVSIMVYWSLKFHMNEKTLGKRIINCRHLFFDYDKMIKSYFEGTSLTTDENYIWKSSSIEKISNDPNHIKKATEAWEKLLNIK